MWTRFMDMCSGGGLKKPPYSYIYIEAPEDEACVIFYNRFGHSPHRVTCSCCGPDYSTSEHEDLAQLASFDRGEPALIVPANEIKPEEREGSVPPEGYVWV